MVKYSKETPQLTGTCVYLREGESTEQLIKRFRKVVSRDGVLEEYKNRLYYVSKGQKARKAKQAAIRRQQQRDALYKSRNNY